MSENKLNDIIQTSLDSIRSMVDSNTVIGSPITTANGTLVIPVSKVFVGFASGGVDYLGKNTQNTSHTVNNFGGGGGTGAGILSASAPAVATALPQVLQAATASDVDRMNRAAEPAPVYIVWSDIQAKGRANSVRVAESTF